VTRHPIEQLEQVEVVDAGGSNVLDQASSRTYEL